MSTPSRILVIAPHPDDEVLGCGGTIQKYTARGFEVHLCVVTEAYEPEWSSEFIKERPAQIAKAAKILGIKKVHTLNFPTVKLDTIPQKDINDALARVVRQVKPEIVFIPHNGDINADHRIVHESSIVALRPVPGQEARCVLSYETLSETEWGTIPFIPNVYEDVSGLIPKKIKAMEVYESELKAFPHPRSEEAIDALAKKRGSEAGFKAAEAFCLVRELRA